MVGDDALTATKPCRTNRPMLRILTVLLLASTPVQAWEVEVDRLCKLVHDEADASVVVTYDPSIPEYAISITLTRDWLNDAVFAIRFDGPRGNTISTGRHVISGDGSTLRVADSGFGNVLNGLEYNNTATALLGDQAVPFSLDGAAPAVREFRACVSGLSV
ncbi:MAG: hypothetical protein AAFZ06_09895 [Pseudomonadota bacterium]